MRLRGRFVLEAAVLIPYMCVFLLYAVYGTLYAHDYAAAAMGTVESGIKGIYRNQDTDSRIEDQIIRDLKQKMEERLLWSGRIEAEAKVSPVCVQMRLSGTGGFFPAEGVKVERTIYRIDPCEILRRSRWLLE